MLMFLLSTLADAAPPDREEMEGIKAAKQGDHVKAVVTFAKVLAGDPRASGSHYYLARSLEELGLVESATAELVEGVKLGPSDGYFRYAIARLAAVAVASGDTHDLGKLVLKTTARSWGDVSRSELALAAGLVCLERGQPDPALEMLLQVNDKAAAYPEALLATGRAQAAKGDITSAVRSWTTLVTTARTPPIDQQAALRESARPEPVPIEALWRDAADRALIEWDALSRTTPNVGAPPLEDVPEMSAAWRRAQLAAARRDLAAGSAKAALKRLDAVQDPPGRRGPPADWLPEAAVLEARAHLARCDTRDATRALDRGAAERVEVSAWLTGKVHDVESAPDAVRVHLGADRGGAVLAGRLDTIDAEQERVAGMSAQLGKTATTRLEGSLDGAERSVSRRLESRQVNVLDALAREVAAAAGADAEIRAALAGPCTPG